MSNNHADEVDQLLIHTGVSGPIQEDCSLVDDEQPITTNLT